MKLKVKINGEPIKAKPSTLNLISIYAADAADKYERENMPGLAKQAVDIAHQIHDILDGVGYYDF